MVVHLQRCGCTYFSGSLNQKGFRGESMGCICSKESPEPEEVDDNEKAGEFNKTSDQSGTPTPSKREDFVLKIRGSVQNVGLVSFLSRQASQTNGGPVQVRKGKNGSSNDEENKARNNERRRKDHNQKLVKKDARVNGKLPQMSRIVSLPNGAEGGQVLAGWPSWLTSVAGDAIKGWIPRRADSFEKLDKIGQGTYSSVYRARDLETGKIVALKKVRFVNMDPESVRFMAREICILRELDHPNVMKLEGLVTSRMSCSLYLVFEYMEHDLAGLVATPGIKFTEPQIKCFMQQLLHGLEHCHSRGVLHRDIKGSNLLIDNNGVLKIGDFGLATFFEPDQKQPLTSHVVTLWYRPPELLLGSTKYGPAIDLWSTGCILAELFAGKPIMPGRTEVEQMHKIFKLCGSPSEDYWQRTKFPHATSFKPHRPYKRCLIETFRNFPSSASALVDKLLSIKPEERGSANSALRSEFFRTDPLPCDPSTLPKYPPSKEFDAKCRNEEARRRKVEAVKGRGPESVRRGSTKLVAEGDPTLPGKSNPKTSSHKLSARADGGTGVSIKLLRGTLRDGFSHSTSMIHPNVLGSSWNKPRKATRTDDELWLQQLQKPRGIEDLSNSSLEKDNSLPEKDLSSGHARKKNRINYSGPLLAPGRNVEDMLKEHERQIQQAVRNAHLGKLRTTEKPFQK